MWCQNTAAAYTYRNSGPWKSSSNDSWRNTFQVFLLVINSILPIFGLSRTFQSTSLSSLLCLDCFITIIFSFLFWFCWGAAVISVILSFTSIVLFYIISFPLFFVFSSSGLLNCSTIIVFHFSVRILLSFL